MLLVCVSVAELETPVTISLSNYQVPSTHYTTATTTTTSTTTTTTTTTSTTTTTTTATTTATNTATNTADAADDETVYTGSKHHQNVSVNSTQPHRPDSSPDANAGQQ